MELIRRRDRAETVAGGRRDEAGMTLVEIVASMVILMITAAAAFSAIHMGQGLNLRVIHRTQGESLIDGKLDSIFVQDFADVRSDTSLIIIDPRDLSVAGDALVGTLFVNVEGSDDPLDGLGTNDPGWPDTTDHKRLDLVIRWPDANGNQAVTRESMMSNPGP